MLDPTDPEKKTYASPERGGAKTNVANDSREHLKRARGGDISREDVAKMKTYGFRNVPCSLALTSAEYM